MVFERDRMEMWMVQGIAVGSEKGQRVMLEERIVAVEKDRPADIGTASCPLAGSIAQAIAVRYFEDIDTGQTGLMDLSAVHSAD